MLEVLGTLFAKLRRERGNPRRGSVRVRLLVESLDDRIVPTSLGTWTKISNFSDGSAPGTMLLLPNGTVMAQEGNNATSSNWYAYTPGSRGYANGSWTSLASEPTSRLFCGSVVLNNGNVLVLGGEFAGDAPHGNSGSGDIYDSLTNTWSAMAPFPTGSFGDDSLQVLPDGTVMATDPNSGNTYIYDPSTDTWQSGPTKLRGDRSDEEGLVRLSDGSFVDYELFTGFAQAQRYFPFTNTWVDAGTVPVPLSSAALNYELGPGISLPNGKVFQIGANDDTALYDPTTNTWQAGPTIPGLSPAGTTFGADDAPCAILPNGEVIFTADASGSGNYSSPTHMFVYDPVANTITDITSQLPSSLQKSILNNPSYVDRMLVLPTGQLMFSDGHDNTYLLQPKGSPAPDWRPDILNVAAQGNGVYTISGYRLCGISDGNAYGDDVQQDENYPIVSLTNPRTGAVIYARTSGWAPGTEGSPGDTVATSTTFTLPSGMPGGIYQLTVSAAGIRSLPVVFDVTSPPPPPGSPPPPPPGHGHHPRGAIAALLAPSIPAAAPTVTLPATSPQGTDGTSGGARTHHSVAHASGKGQVESANHDAETYKARRSSEDTPREENPLLLPE
jgi:hypothetical protein